MKDFDINIIEHVSGKIVSGRHAGNKIRNQFISYYDMGVRVNLNFSGIQSVSHSFIDELVGIFMYHDKKKALEIFKFSNCNKSVQSTIKLVISDRINSSKRYA